MLNYFCTSSFYFSISVIFRIQILLKMIFKHRKQPDLRKWPSAVRRLLSQRAEAATTLSRVLLHQWSCPPSTSCLHWPCHKEKNGEKSQDQAHIITFSIYHQMMSVLSNVINFQNWALGWTFTALGLPGFCLQCFTTGRSWLTLVESQSTCLICH